MKKVIIIIVILLAIPFLKTDVEAKTLRQAYDDLAKLQRDASNTQNQKVLTEKEIEQTRTEISIIYNEINSIKSETVRLQNEISDLNSEIERKDKEIKDLSKYLQLSAGESIYLEYAFGSETLTEFVYRLAVIEQLNKYNSELIDEMETNIEKNENTKVELAKKQTELDKKEDEYVYKLNLLGEEKKELEEAYSDIAADIAEAKSLLSYYERQGCKMDDDLDKCASKLGYNGSYKRPVAKGYITSGFGPRVLYGVFHYGIDIGMGIGTPLYPVANGIVTSVSGANNASTCGGLSLTVVYNIKGTYYTSTYMHLSSVSVKAGEVVSVDQVVARSGNSGYCTTGAHLHFAMTYKARYVSGGLYGVPSNQTYSSYETYKSLSFDQSGMFKFGKVGSSFSTRNL